MIGFIIMMTICGIVLLMGLGVVIYASVSLWQAGARILSICGIGSLLLMVILVVGCLLYKMGI